MVRKFFASQLSFLYMTPEHIHKAKLRQIYECVYLFLRSGITPKEYGDYGFYHKDCDFEHMSSFISFPILKHGLQKVVNERAWIPLVDNKWTQNRYCASLNLPVTQVYGHFHSQIGVTCEGLPLKTQADLKQWLLCRRPQALVIKSTEGGQGSSVHVLDRIIYQQGNITLFQLERCIDGDTFIQALDKKGYILEEKLTSHPMLERLSPHSLNTVRVVTFRHSTGETAIDWAFLKVGRLGSVVDNHHQGGLTIPVDLHSGTLGLARNVKDVVAYQNHPDTGARICGEQLPYWEQVLGLAHRAAAVFPGVRSIGWDIAITATGPVIVEANTGWGITMHQIHGQGYLQPAIVERLANSGIRLRPLPWGSALRALGKVLLDILFGGRPPS